MLESDLKAWQDDVGIYNEAVDTIVRDKFTLKKSIEDHLNLFFDFDAISFNEVFTEIKIRWNYDKEPAIHPKDLVDLNMDFIITHEFDDRYGDGIVLKVYPFGLEEFKKR